MEELGLTESGLMLASLLAPGGMLNSGSSIQVSDALDPQGVYKAAGLDPYGNPLPGGGGYSVRPNYRPSTMDPVAYYGDEMRASGARYSAGRPGLTSLPDGPETMKDLAIRKGGQGTKGIISKVDDALEGTARAQKGAIGKAVRGASKLMGHSPSAAGNAGRMAMQALKNPILSNVVKFAGPVGAAMSVGDLVLGDESFGNKAMDAGLMAAGGFLGSAVPVVGTALGATGGKMLSDGIQFFVGGGKSDRERQLEELLASRGAV